MDGIEIGGVIKLRGIRQMGWQATVEKTLRGVCEHQSDKKLVLFFDELPYMLQKIASD